MAEAPGGVAMEIGSDGIAIVTLSNPPLNVVTLSMIGELKEVCNEVMKRNDVKAVVITGEGEMFCCGSDLKVAHEVVKTGDVSLLPDQYEFLSDKIEDGTKPFVAAIQGLALGAGLELAMACYARICTPKTQLGVPELSFGLIPGAGGTQRLPRLVGLRKAFEMLLSSKPITAEEGRKHGLVDAVVPPHELLTVSRLWALDIAERRKPWIQSLHVTDRLVSLSEVPNIMMIARQEVKKTAQNLPQYKVCLDVIEEGIIHGGQNGLVKEDKVAKELLLADTTKGLMHVFFAQREALKVPGVTDAGLKPRKIKKVAVIGGGLMGSGIATALLLSNVYVVLKEINSEALSKGMKSVEDNIGGLVAMGKLAQDKAGIALSLLRGSLDYSEFKDVDVVIEAVFENVTLKQTIFSEIEKSCPTHCIFATNTSAIDLSAIGERTNCQDRIIGAHFFSPAHMMPLVEIIRTNMTSAQVILDLITLAQRMKKVPIVVQNSTGFAVTRIVFAYTQSAHVLANLGVNIFRIDGVLRGFGQPMGPFQLQDLIGYGVGLSAEKQFASAFPDSTFRSPLLQLLVKSGRNGKNNGRGYYTYEKGRKPKPDPSVLPIIEESRKLTNIMPTGEQIDVTDQEILEMVLFPVVDEACRVLEERVVFRASDLDVASVLGMSFPSYRGGILFWADQVGPSYIYDSLNKWAKLYSSFFKPSGFLQEQVSKGLTLSEPTSSISRL